MLMSFRKGTAESLTDIGGRDNGPIAAAGLRALLFQFRIQLNVLDGQLKSGFCVVAVTYDARGRYLERVAKLHVIDAGGAK